MQPITLNSIRPLEPQMNAAEKKAIRSACEEFEGFFLGILLKEGLKPMLSESADAPPGQETMTHLAIEHTAREMGRQGSTGLADMLYDQLSGLL